MSLEARVGAFVLLGLAFLGLAVLLLGNYTFGRRYVIYVTFQDAANLAKKAPVKLSGVQIGNVQDLTLSGRLAKAELAIRKGVPLYRDAEFSVGSTGIIGSKYLDIAQGRPSAGLIEPGETVAGVESIPLDKEVTTALKKVEKLLDDLEGTNQHGQTLAENLRDTVRNVRELTANLNDLIASSKPHLEKAMRQTDDISGKLDKLLDRSNHLVASLNTNEGAVGTLLHDPKVKEDVKQAVQSVKQAAGTVNDVLARLQQFRVWWNVDERYQYNNGSDISHTDIGLKIQPREGRYYYVGIENAGLTSNKVSPLDFGKPNTVDGLLGWTTGAFDLAAGVIRSAGGVQLTWTPFYKSSTWANRFSFMGRSYNFNRNVIINGVHFNQPETDVGALTRITKWLSLGWRVDDVSTAERRFEAWLHVPFEDRDIAYLFGLATFGAAGAKARSPNNGGGTGGP
jgi:phospholipid/cholesterol/gamma-HCH transport system substrate-binding protein